MVILYLRVSGKGGGGGGGGGEGEGGGGEGGTFQIKSHIFDEK